MLKYIMKFMKFQGPKIERVQNPLALFKSPPRYRTWRKSLQMRQAKEMAPCTLVLALALS